MIICCLNVASKENLKLGPTCNIPTAISSSVLILPGMRIPSSYKHETNLAKAPTLSKIWKKLFRLDLRKALGSGKETLAFEWLKIWGVGGHFYEDMHLANFEKTREKNFRYLKDKKILFRS